MSGFTSLVPVVLGVSFPVSDALVSNWDGQTATLVMETGGTVAGLPLVIGVNPYRATQVVAVGNPNGKLWAAHAPVVGP